jgi:hypothetical protein
VNIILTKKDKIIKYVEFCGKKEADVAIYFKTAVIVLVA